MEEDQLKGNAKDTPHIEVSLPGSNECSIEQPAILQVLSPLNATEEKKQPQQRQASQQKDDVNENPLTASQQSSEDFILHNDDDANSSLKNLVSSSNIDTDHLVKTNTSTTSSPTISPPAGDKLPCTPTKDCKTEPFLKEAGEEKEDQEQEPINDNILDIESHLIETLNEITPNKESVGINELQPVDDELQVGCSKVETKDNVRSVIEVQPAEVVTKQPIEQFIETDDPLQAAQLEQILAGAYLNGDSHLNKEEIEKAAQQLLQDIEEEIVKAFETNTYKGTDLVVPDHSEAPHKTEEPTEEANENPPNTSQTTDDVDRTSEDQPDGAQNRTESQLSQVVDQQISEVTSILDSQTKEAVSSLKPPASTNLKLVTVPSPKTASEEAERKLFIDSLPALQGSESSDAEKLALDCKREYYQSLKKYLVQSSADKPPVPIQTYRWEDLRRARERGGYPWTHLYKRPLGPDDQPEIVLMLRKSQEIRFLSESPKSNKKVRIDDQVLIQETHPYLQELSEEEEEEEGHHSEHHLPRDSDHENHSLHSESFSCVSDSVLATAKAKAANRFSKVRRLFRRRRYGVRTNDDAQSLPDSFTNASSLQHSLETVPGPPTHPIYEHPKSPRCFPIMKKLKSMADRQKKRLNIKRLHLGKDDKVAPIPDEEPKIIKLKSSPKAQRSDIPHFIEKQDSDDVLEIQELDESPSRKRLGRHEEEDDNEEPQSSIVKPEEIIEITDVAVTKTTATTSDDAASSTQIETEAEDDSNKPPKKAPRLRREHVYEEIDHPDDAAMAAAEELKFILDATSVDALKQSLATQDNSALNEVASAKHTIPLDRMGSSEEEAVALNERATPERKSNTLLAPISSIDSASSDEDRSKTQLQPVTEEEQDEEEEITQEAAAQSTTHLTIGAQEQLEESESGDKRLSLKKEASPAPSDNKKVTFSHVEDEADPHREDIDLPAEQMEAAKEANKWKNTTNDHEYEPIGMPSTEDQQSSDIKDQRPNESHTAATDAEDQMKAAEKIQREMEDNFFTTVPLTTPQTEIEVDAEPIDETLDEAEPPKSGMKSFMASAQDRTRKMQLGLKTQAGKLRTKLKATPKKAPSGSPKAKERRKFKAPEFSKIKMPEIKRPDMSKFKDFKRPEFTKFSKPDMSKFKLPEMSAIKLGRSKSFKESETSPADEDMSVEVSETTKKTTEASSPQKKLFDFNFGTYPRALRKKKKPLEVESSFDTGTATEATSVIPSTETQPSVESSSSPQGDRGPGPVRSRWADKFSDVSYNDSEGSRYRRYGSEQESFDRESSLERRMREDLEDAVSEEPNMGILGGVADNRQFAEFDEENRAIHEISNLRSGEFKRRPMVHQDSDVRSEDSKDAVGWTDREIQKNILLRKAENEAEASYLKYQTDDMARHDNQSTASSGKKVVLEEIGEDEFFLRKRGISQDNIEINQYIRNAFRDDYDKPINSLQHVGQTSDYGDYDVPPPKPRRLHKTYQPENDSQVFDEYGDDFSVSHNGSEYFGAPRRPMRKGRSRSKYSMDSQEVKYMDDEYMREPSHEGVSGVWNDLNVSGKENIPVRHEHRLDEGDDVPRPQPPRRQKRRRDNSMDKDSYINGFGGRSVSNSFLQPTEDVIVYRTEHEYHHVPLATPEKYSDSLSPRKSASHYDLDDQISRGAISLDHNVLAADGEADKYVIEMLENDGYAVVRKEQVPKPTPPARRKRFSHSPGDRFATMPNMRTKRSTPPPPERPPPPRGYTPVSDIVRPTVRQSALSLDARPNYVEDDYEEPGFNHERPETPRDLQSGEIINKMKYRPLPPPPRPPREKRNRSASKGSEALQFGSDEVDVVDGIDTEDTASHFEEVEASTQTDPLPDDFVCEEFEITDDMKVIEPRIIPKTIEDMLQEELEKELENVNHQVIDSDQLAKGLQRFRDANQRSMSERSRTSSQAKSLSRPQTPSAIVVERQSSTPVLKDNNETMLEASLVVRPIDDLELEEEELRREGLLTDSSQHSLISDTKEDHHLPVSEASYDPSSADIDEALGNLASDQETQQTDEEVERTLQRYRDELDEIGRQLMETQTTSQEPSPSVSREEIKDSDREEHSEKWETSDREDLAKEPWQLSDIEELRSDMEDVTSEREELRSDMDDVTSEREELRSDLEDLRSDNEREAADDEEEAPFEKEFTPLPKEYHVDAPTEEEPPLPPPRRKSTTTVEPSPSRFESEPEQEPPVESKELTPLQAVVKPEETATTQLPARLGDLEVERLRVHALQAGQIMVSQLHGQQISADELECKSGNIVVQNIELPPGLIEDIVERVRQTERSQHLTVETQTSLQNSTEPSPIRDAIPPPKPPRLRDLEATKKPAEIPPVQNADEQTQTEVETSAPAQVPITTSPQSGTLPVSFPTAEYLQSLAPLAFYNLHRAQAGMADQAMAEISRSTQHHRQRRSASPEVDGSKTEESADEVPRRRRTRSTRTPSAEDPQGVAKAGRKFITACSLSLARIINQLTDYVRGKETKEGVEDATASSHVPALAVLFIVITFVVLIFLLTGRNVHTHHWDYFNPPGQDGRQS